jgi:cellulose synthase/poly-beta-1,6-N-acetylglucosamine synthase-like glycosyltransferase
MGGAQRRIYRSGVTGEKRADAGEPVASIIVCTRDRPDVLGRCLSSLRELQAEFPYEIVVVDNSSAGTAREVVADASVRYVHEARRGLSRARNAGVDASRGDVLAFIDDDAVADTRWLSALVRVFDEGDVGAAAGEISSPPGQSDLAAFAIPVRRVLDRSTTDWFGRAAFGGVGNGPNMAFRRAALKEIGGFDERLGLGAPIAGSEEHDAFVRLVAAGFKVVSTPEAIVTHESKNTDRTARAFTQRRAAAAYIMWMVLARPGLRWRAVRYAVEALLGTRRRWRPPGAPAILTRAQSARAIAGALPVVIRALLR